MLAYIDIESKNGVLAAGTLKPSDLRLKLILGPLVLLPGAVIALRLLVSLLGPGLLRMGGLRCCLPLTLRCIVSRL